MRRDEATLLDIAKAARLITHFKEGFDEDAFLGDEKTQSAILHQLLVLGESVKRLTDPFRESHPEIPWRLIAGMRDRLIHEYDSVDIEEVWRIADVDVPRLLVTLQPILPPEPPSDSTKE